MKLIIDYLNYSRFYKKNENDLNIIHNIIFKYEKYQ